MRRGRRARWEAGAEGDTTDKATWHRGSKTCLRKAPGEDGSRTEFSKERYWLDVHQGELRAAQHVGGCGHKGNQALQEFTVPRGSRQLEPGHLCW